MTFRVEEDEGRGLVRVTMEGVFEKADVMAMVTAARGVATDRGWNILYDMRAALPGQVGIADVFWMPRSLPVLQDRKARGVSVAVLHSGQLNELPDFWENSFRIQARVRQPARGMAQVREDRYGVASPVTRRSSALRPRGTPG